MACVTCMSNPNNAVTQAGSFAILLMLALLGGVFVGVFQFMRYLCRCERSAIEAAGGPADRDQTP